MKKILLIIIGIMIFLGMAVFGIRLISGEDNWICDKGEWIKHGNPSAPKPTSLCPGAKVFEETFIPTALQPTVQKEEKKGIIEGSLSFPSEGIPENMQVCAENLQSMEQFCTKEHIKNPKYTYGEGYKIEVPEGNYFVFAALSDNPEQKAYYSEFVTCGLNVECKSHDPIPVAVTEGKTTSGIDPQDWYKQ